MAKIYKFEDKRGNKPHHRSTDAVKAKKTGADAFNEIYSTVIEEWVTHSTSGTIDQYFHDKIPEECRLTGTLTYCSDLNILSKIEKYLGMCVTLYYPKTTPGNEHGWMASFKYKRWVFTTPSDVASEEGARALNVLLFIAFRAAIVEP
jgi:hypothetical protein